MAKPLSLNELRHNAVTFARAWRDEPGNEKQQAQDFVRELLTVYGIDQRSQRAFEEKVKRSSTGRHGYIDGFVPGILVVEMKSAGEALEVAEQQALDYIPNLPPAERPRYVLASDFKRFRLLDLEAPTEASRAEFPLEAFPLEFDRLSFLAGYQDEQRKSDAEEEASVKAAKIMASLYEELEASGYADHDASVFLVRTLFCLYADDAGVWKRDLFEQFISSRTSPDGSDLGAVLSSLYEAMSVPTAERQINLDELILQFPYVNGGIFEERLSIPAFNAAMREKLLAACHFDWSEISPAIFGSLFQSVKSKEARRELGEHYTTEANILKVLRPMFLDELEGRLHDQFNDAAGLRKLRRDMGELRILDPACGCGNFLVVAYREMRALDLQILERLQHLDATGSGGKRTDSRHDPTLLFDAEDLPVRLSNFFGIELEEWPATIARAALHLVEHQANQSMERALGQGPEPLPLDKIETIHVANAVTSDWAGIVPPSKHLLVVGNPPFIGYDQRTAQQKTELQHVWGTDKIGRLDYVTAWYAKSLQLFRRPEYDGEFAFVSTNSITQGEPVPLLFGPLKDAGWRIKFAHRTFVWTSEAPDEAHVHCVVIGFEPATPRPKPARIFDYPQKDAPALEREVPAINAYLIDAEDVLVRKRTSPISPLVPRVINGSVAGDSSKDKDKPKLPGLVMSREERERVGRNDPVAAKYLRPYIGGQDFLNGNVRWCLWLNDWDPADLGRSPELRQRLDNVRTVRGWSTELSTRRLAATPYLFKHIAQPTTRYICIPRTVSANRPYLAVGYLEPEYIVSNGSFWASDPDGVVFALASSAMFMAWQKAVGGRLKSDPRFANTIVWNNFPVPELSTEDRERLISRGQAVLAARESDPSATLASQYEALSMSKELVAAHRALDAVVDAAFGLRGEVSDDDRVRVLFREFAKLLDVDALPVAPRASRKRR